MASKNETRAAILELAAEIGVPAPDVGAIDKLEPLEALLKELQDKKVTANASAAEPEAQAEESLVTVYEVAAGKSLTSLSGTKSAGDEVSARDFADGQKAIDGWVAQGFVTKSAR